MANVEGLMLDQTNEAHLGNNKTGVSHFEDIAPDSEPVPRLHAKTFCIIFAVVLIYVAQLVNLVGVGAYGRAIAATVGDADRATWLVSECVIMTVVFGPPFSQAADYWGRRWFLIVPTFLGVIGSIILSRATSMSMALTGNAILSISYGAQPLLHAVASEVLTHRSRAAAQASVNIGSGLGGIIGLLAGAALTLQDGGFRKLWYIAAGIYALATIVAFIFYTPPPRPLQTELTFKEKVHRLDWLGYILLACGLVLFVMGLSWAENPYSWRDVHVLCPLLIGATFILTLIIYEWKFKFDGMVHHDLFSRNRNFGIALGCIFVEGLVFFAANVYLPYQVSVMYETNSIRVALHFCVAFIVYTVAVVGPAIYCYKYKKLRIPVVFAFTCFLAFNICMATTGLESGKAVWGYPVFLGCGLAVALCGLVTAAQLSAPPELIAITSGLMVAVRSFGGAIGVAIYTSIFNSKFNGSLAGNIADATLPLGLPESSLPALIGDLSTGSNPTGIIGISPAIIEAAQSAFLQTFANSFRGVWITAACFTVVALAASCFLYDPVKDFNLHIDAPAEKSQDIYGGAMTTEVA